MALGDLTVNFGFFRVRILRPLKLLVSFGPVVVKTITYDEGTGPVDIALGDNQFTTIHLAGVDAAELAGVFAKPPVWEVADPTILLATPSTDGSSCRIEAAVPPKLGLTVLTVTDADDPTVAALAFNVTVGGENVAKLVATVDPPTEKPPAT